VLTFGDLTLYADAPELFDLLPLPPSHTFLGPVEWSPDDPLPPGWAEDPRRYPVYVTLGSSGDLRLLPRVLEGLRSLPVDVLVATAGRTSQAEARRLSVLSSGADSAAETPSPPDLGARIRIVPFVAGARAAAAARLVISNGGSTTGYQALTAGCPVLGLPHNLEQHLAMEGIVRAGAGRSLSARHVRRESLRGAVEEMLGSTSLAEGARRVAGHLRRHHATNVFPALVRRVLDDRGRDRSSGSGREGAAGQQPGGEGASEDHQPHGPDVAHEDMVP
jgi:UDP:flavonoid glycosyltransferase YjiC (YdhE family)